MRTLRRSPPEVANPLALPRLWVGAHSHVLTDVAEPHFSEVKIVPAGLPPSREQWSRVPKVIQHGTQPQAGKEREK